MPQAQLIGEPLLLRLQGALRQLGKPVRELLRLDGLRLLTLLDLLLEVVLLQLDLFLIQFKFPRRQFLFLLRQFDFLRALPHHKLPTFLGLAELPLFPVQHRLPRCPALLST